MSFEILGICIPFVTIILLLVLAPLYKGKLGGGKEEFFREFSRKKAR
ncbi:MAG: hypothetical protein KJZ60_02055 [Ignavibacteriaceae bacterium]|nr:hypothetical protein [Ignavibacteriaceae bacterium]